VISQTRTTFVFLRPSSPDDFGDLEPEVVDSDTVGQDSMYGSGTAHEMLDDATSSH
jgi:hypothetical protein